MFIITSETPLCGIKIYVSICLKTKITSKLEPVSNWDSNPILSAE